MIFTPAYAKLNLALSVVGRRADGRHDLRSVIVRLDWHDLVGVEIGAVTAALGDAAAGPGRDPSTGAEATAAGETAEITMAVTGPAAAEVPMEGNLLLRAARAVLPARPTGAVRLCLEKRLPAAAGLGGGSADAAAVLQLLGGTGRPRWDPGMRRLADTLGSDVPACLAGGSLLVGGAGERLEPILHPSLDLAVAIAGRSGTAATFAALTPDEWRGPDRPMALAELLAEGRPLAPELCGSDLEAAACRAHPELASGLRRLRGALPEITWHLTGSGGAVFALTGGRGAAEAVAARARDLGFAARACRTVAA